MKRSPDQRTLSDADVDQLIGKLTAEVNRISCDSGVPQATPDLDGERETHHRSRMGALVAHAYELIDRGPELERDALVTMICERLLSLVGADAAVLWVSDEDGQSTAERICGIRPSATAIAVERALVELIATEGCQLINSSEAPLRPGLVQLCEKLDQERSGTVCVGLQRRHELVGVLCLHRVGVGSFEAWEAADAERFASFAALALHQMAERERAQRDEVTGMLGRTLLLRALDDRLAGGQPFALACVDFDGLKAVNESLGYEAGNELIRAVAQAIATLLKPGEIVGRLHGRGGDEFVCLLGECDQPSLERRCQMLEAALDRAAVPAELASSYLGVSVGASLALGSTPAGSLFTAAENAMRERKQERRRSQGRWPTPAAVR
jgi:diguanylate cyclase (GGDEF)-like protein